MAPPEPRIKGSAPYGHHAVQRTRRLPRAPTRELRGLEIFRRGGIERAGREAFVVPGCSGGEYLVDLDAEACSCPDYRRRREACKHVYAATLFRAWLRGTIRRLALALADDDASGEI